MADTVYPIPTLGELVNRVSSDLATRLPGRDTRLKRTIVWALAITMAGVSYTLWRFIAWTGGQISPRTATGDRVVGFADTYGLAPTEATFAAGPVVFPGVNGSILPIGAVMVRGDGAQFRVSLGGTVSGGVVSVSVKALVAGAAGNSASATVLTLTSPIAGITSAGAVGSAGITDGLDPEFVEDLRGRVLARLAAPPQGGAVADYDEWTRQIAGVSRVFVQPRALGPGTVRVFFVVKNSDTGAIEIPDDAKVAEVQAQLDELAPVTADVTAAKLTAKTVAFSLHVSPGTDEVKAAVAAELADLFDRVAEPDTVIENSSFHEAISRAAGQSWHTIGDVGGGGSAADVSQSTTEFARLGAITWS